MDGVCSHREYYTQFVNDKVIERVVNTIGVNLLLASTDEHLNDIPMKKWDDLAGFAFRSSEMIRRPGNIDPIKYEQLKEAGDGVSAAGLVCIYKEAAKQIIEANTIRHGYK